METITTALYDDRRKTAERSRDLKESAELHREIYIAIHSRNAAEARSVMTRHLTMAQSSQSLEGSPVQPMDVQTRSRESVLRKPSW